MKWHYTPVVTAAFIAATLASAADLPKKKAPEAPPPPPAWIDTLTVDGYVEGGVAINFNQPFNKLNWGHLYTDRANWPTFNGGVLTVMRPIDPKSTGYDFGFKVQGQIGEDARYNHLTGFLDYLIHDRTQIAILEANAQAHLPWTSFVSEGGVDVKAGIFPTYNGAEVMYAKDNLFYSHSYIFNFGPFLHTGLMTSTHVRDWLDIYAGVTTGVNNWIGYPGQPNASPSFHGGFGLNLLDGNLTVLGIVHHGPQNSTQGRFNFLYTPAVFANAGLYWPNNVPGGIPAACACEPNTTNRTFTNLTTTWKVTENLTLITDMAYNRESGWNPISFTGISPAFYPAWDATGIFPAPLASLPQKPQGADSYAVAQYASYKVNDIFKVNGRVEFYRDNKNFFVGAFPGYFDSVNAFHGFACPSCISRPAGVGTSYLALTAGVTITPELPKLPIITGLILRPEFRWDTAVNGTTPFFRGNGNGFSSSQGMFNMDVIVPFSLL
ncbi:MAG: outer membrane beta-barrel protein [Methylocystis sp.]|jgi:hypothetical protein